MCSKGFTCWVCTELSGECYRTDSNEKTSERVQKLAYAQRLLSYLSQREYRC